MPFNFSSTIWKNAKEHFFRDRELKPAAQNGPHCVSTALAIVTGKPARVLRLNSLCLSYAHLWSQLASDLLPDCWTSGKDQLFNDFELPWDQLNPKEWDWKSPLRSDYGRRQALLEIDTLVSVALGLTLEELLTICRIQFPIMYGYELIDEYDARGVCIPNTTRKNQGAKEFREARDSWDGQNPLTVSWPIDNGLKIVTKTFHPPFSKVDQK